MMMEIYGKAIWNDVKGAWEVEIKTKDLCENLSGNLCLLERTTKSTVKACDDLVFPLAVAEHNGYEI